VIYEALNLAVLESIPMTARRFLDLGCGAGNLGAAIKEQRGGEVVGVTFSEPEAELAAKRLDRVLVADLDDFVPPKDLGTFDVVICSHVLEHLREPSRLLRVLRPCLGAHGVLVVALPNILYWKQRALMLRGHFKYTGGGLMDSTHLRFFDWDAACSLLTESGYELCEPRATGHLPLPVVRGLLPAKCAKWIDGFATKRFPGLFGVQFVLIGRPIAQASRDGN